MTTATGLDSKHRIGDHVRVVDHDGHTIIVVNTPAASADIALQGAQLLSWTPSGTQDVLWCAPLPDSNSGKAIRGGVPICWPWFGPHPTDATQPQHGLLRTSTWTLAETRATDAGAHVALIHSAFGCALRFEIAIGAQLTLTLITTNTSATPVSITEALHTYFRIANVAEIAVHGLDGLIYRDNADGMREKRQAGPVRPRQETIAVFPDTPDVIEIADATLGRRIHISRTGGRSTVVWHPGAAVASFKDIPAEMAPTFVCVESGNVAPHAVTLAPGASHRLSVTYDVVPRLSGLIS